MPFDEIQCAHFSIGESEKQANAKVAFAKIPFMESIRAIRLRKLISDDFDGSQKALSLRSKISLSQLGQYLGGYRNLGEKTARKIEESCGKPQGWLDAHDVDSQANTIATTSYSDDIQEVIKLMESTDDRGRMKCKLAVLDALDLHNSHISRTRTLSFNDEEVRLVEQHRQSSKLGKSLIKTALDTAEKDDKKPHHRKAG